MSDTVILKGETNLLWEADGETKDVIAFNKTGTLTITANGIYDVANYTNVIVNTGI